uniref:ATP synthase complex subunit 8 n=1 Tax=Photinus corruscus TaxID=3446125 RepID=A0A343S6K2_9COLE|nr:ATP synthase F0 subunit 8 [Ellychnia corrusca]
MPQMAPLNWLVLLLYFCIILMLYNMTIYTIFNYKSKVSSKIELNKLTWKW